jgi:hypothetical protein
VLLRLAARRHAELGGVLRAWICKQEIGRTMFNTFKSWLLLIGATVGFTLIASIRLYTLPADSSPGPPATPRPAGAISELPGPFGGAPFAPDAPPPARVRWADPFRPVTDVPIVSRAVGDEKIDPMEYVLGVVVGGEARAYPVNMIAEPARELMNDVVGRRPIAVSWCNESRCPNAFSREVQGRTLTLFVTGELLHSNMIFQDVQTGSEWIQLSGTSSAGPLKGERLDPIPTVWTDWKTWSTSHPDTTAALILPRTMTEYRCPAQKSASGGDHERIGRLQWGLVRGEHARSWPFAELAKSPVVNDQIAGEPLAIFFDTDKGTINAFDRRVGDATLVFRQTAEGLIDDQTQSAWDVLTGRAIRGPLAGQCLTPIPGVMSAVEVWSAFHPKTEVWKAVP